MEIIEHGLNKETQKVRTITTLTLVDLAEAATLHNIKSYDLVLKTFSNGIRSQHGKY